MRSVLQIFMEGEEAAHCASLLRWMAPEAGARVVDLGCGFGGVTSNMGRLRPDLTFTLVNKTPDQAPQCVVADMTSTGLSDRCADVVMCAYSAGYVPLDRLLTEVVRLLRPGGMFFLVDMTGEDKGLESLASYAVRTPEVWMRAIEDAGMLFPLGAHSSATTTEFQEVLAHEPEEVVAEWRRTLSNLRPFYLMARTPSC